MFAAKSHTKLIICYFHATVICSLRDHLCSTKHYTGNEQVLSRVGKHTQCLIFSIYGLHNSICIFLHVLSLCLFNHLLLIYFYLFFFPVPNC